MIEMNQKEEILHYHRVDGLSLREISRRVGLNRKTVTRYVREYEASVREDPEEGLDICLASKPKYPARNLSNPLVPYDNNASEQGVRKIKIKQKVSGCFRTDGEADDFAKLHSIVETAIKNGNSKYNAILAVVQQ